MNFDNASDSDLVRHFAATADQSAFTELVNRHAPMVWRTCRRLAGSHHDAEDAFQAVFALLSERASQLGDHHSLAGWLHSTAWNVAARQRRSESRLRQRERRAASQDGNDGLIAAPLVFDENDSLLALQRGIEALPPEYREALVLHHLQEYTLREIAEVTGSPIGTVAARVSRARTMLREQLADWGVDLNLVAVVGLLEIARRRSLRRRILHYVEKVTPAAPAIELAAAKSNALSMSMTPAAVTVPAANASVAAAVAECGSSSAMTLNGISSGFAAFIQTPLGGAAVATATVILATAVAVGGVKAIQSSLAPAESSSSAGLENARAAGTQPTTEAGSDNGLWSFKWTNTGGSGAVPEPASAALSGGAAGWLLMRRRTKSTAARANS